MVIPLEYQPQFRLAAMIIAAQNVLPRLQDKWHWTVQGWQDRCNPKPIAPRRIKGSRLPLIMAVAAIASLDTRR